jgi:hypothetical protein
MKRALVLSLICVVGLTAAGFAQSLTGTWNTLVCFDPTQTNFSVAIDLRSTLAVTYTIGDWAFTTTTQVRDGGWYDQDFSVTGLFGLITVSSALDFNVPVGAFGEWKTTLGLNMAGVTFGASFYLSPDWNYWGTGSSAYTGTDTFLNLTGSAGVGSAVVGSISVWLGTPSDGNACDFDFYSVNIGLDFTFCDCILVDSDIYFTCGGFQYVKFCTTGIPIPNIPWLSFNACLKFTEQSKEIIITPVFDFGASVCIDLYIQGNSIEPFFQPYTTYAYPADSFIFDNFKLVGLGFSCDIGGVTFGALSHWGDYTGYLKYRPGKLAYKAMDIWEVYWITLDADACCGGVFGFDLAVFFTDTGTNLFDVAIIEADVNVNVTTQFELTVGIDADVVKGFTSFCLGFNVTW